MLQEMLREQLGLCGHGPACQILEFGGGAGYQAEWVGQLGHLVVSDMYIDRDLSLPDGVPFVLCDIARAPFGSRQFDLIFSNHVIEHLADRDRSFQELQRIGRTDCLYAFAVPTALWVLLSVPVQYRDKAGNLWTRMRRMFGVARQAMSEDHSERVDHSSYDRSLLGRLLPHGHGRFPKFWHAFSGFRDASWRSLFSRHGFELVRERPVLCYGPAGWPVIPPNRTLTRFGMYSSKVFFLRKKL